MTFRIPVLALSLVVALASQAIAQSAYYWDDAEGGLVDTQTGLVWGFGPSNAPPGHLYTYGGAVFSAADAYANTLFGLPFTDWRIPTKAELVDGAAKGVWEALAVEALLHGLDDFHTRLYWASDAPFKVKGHWLAYAVDIDTGEFRAYGVGKYPWSGGSIFRAIVVRQAGGAGP